MKIYEFRQVDVFTESPLKGNPLAVVLGADSLTDRQMREFANWMNLSETAFLLDPSLPDADYRLRIFTPSGELSFAGHPTLGSCHVWLAAGGRPKGSRVVQECAVGRISVKLDGDRLAFAAPALIRSGPLDVSTFNQAIESLGVNRSKVLASNWVDNGPGWLALLFEDRDFVLNLKPDFLGMGDLHIGVVSPHASDATKFEVRAFAPAAGIPEDPVAGSLIAGIAQWLIGSGLAEEHFLVTQGAAIGREGKVYVQKEGPAIWVGGRCTTYIQGSLTI
jgi:PhzF family phenazine biosynthesis protein